MRRRPVAEDGEHRVDRDHPADEEGHGQKAEIGGDDDHEEAQHGAHDLRRTGASAPAHPFCSAHAQGNYPFGLFLRDASNEVGVEARAELQALDVAAVAGNFGLLEDDHERAFAENGLLQFLVGFRTLGAVTLEQGILGLLRQFRNVPGIAPGKRLVLAFVGVVRVAGEGFGIRVRVEIVRCPTGRYTCRGCGRGTSSASACRRPG